MVLLMEEQEVTVLMKALEIWELHIVSYGDRSEDSYLALEHIGGWEELLERWP